MSKNPKGWWNSMKVANNDGENHHIFWPAWGISMKFSGKMLLMIMLIRYIFVKTTGGDQIDPPAFLGLNVNLIKVFIYIYIIM